jgi:signal transduction histidine kinase/ligand-binding sensor domain-containing protein
MKAIQQYRGVMLLLILLAIAAPVSQLFARGQVYRHLTTRDGLPSGFVWHMMQDRNGFIWTATNGGISKYDGYNFTNYQADVDNPDAISSNLVYTIREINSGLFVVGTSTAVDVFNPATEVFRSVRLSGGIPPIAFARDVHVMDSGDIWVAASDGLYHITGESLLADTASVQFHPLPESLLPEEFIGFTSMAHDGRNILWAGSNRYLHKFHLENREFMPIGPVDDAVESILKGNIWSLLWSSGEMLAVTSEAGLAVWRDGADAPEAVTQLGPLNREQLAGAFFQSVTEDANDNIWLGTGISGAIRWNPETGDVVTFRHDPGNENSIHEDDVHYVFVDDQQNVWFGYHFLGLSVMHSQEWSYTFRLATEEFDPDHPANRLFEFTEDREGNLWFPTHAGLVFHPADGRPAVAYALDPGLPIDKKLGHIVIDEEHQVILAVSADGNHIHRFDPDTGTFTDETRADSLGMIIRAFTDSTGHYFTTFSGKIIRIDRVTLEPEVIRVPIDETVASEVQPTLVGRDRDGNYLMIVVQFRGTELVKAENFLFHPETRSFTEVDIRMPENVIMNSPPKVSDYQAGVIWIRFNTGIFRQNLLTGESELLFQSDSGIINESSGIIHEDSEGYLWMNNQTGIMRLDPVTQSITYFETDSGIRAGRLMNVDGLSNGDILFSGIGGYLRFNPREIQQEAPIRKIHITELTAGPTVYPTLYNDQPTIEIESSDNNLAFSFMGLNYRDPAFTRYRYRIAGYDEDWNNVGTQRRVFLANLPPGSYTFEVQAAPRFGAFSEDTAAVSFVILPPWWKTWPAYVLYFLLFIGLVLATDRFQRRRLLRKMREQARDKELEQAKEIEKAYRILEETHSKLETAHKNLAISHEHLKTAQEQLVQQEKLASLGQLTAGIAHEIKNPLNFVNNFSDVSMEMVDEALEMIREIGPNGLAEKTADLLSDIKSNLAKIHEHGSRADGIVKSMLQHSRGGSGKKEPTDLNALVKEYVNLAFHGMRAGKNPITVEIDLQLDESAGKVPLIAEDFSRVILNLCNNAFDAMREKSENAKGKTQKPDVYAPKLTVRTNSDGGKLMIEIEDNGPGIPDDIKDKILQPFFTTKKGTAGTGLGLSITHDIIKAHGGSIDIRSQPGQTVFSVTFDRKNG